jgi:hypothetical protein
MPINPTNDIMNFLENFWKDDIFSDKMNNFLRLFADLYDCRLPVLLTANETTKLVLSLI